MKNSCFLVLIFLSFLARSQENKEKIKLVENGLIPPSIILDKKDATGKNILDQLKKYRIYGASAAVVVDGKINWVKGYGFTNHKKEQPISNTTLFQSASIGKIITALVALKLVEEGKLDLDEDINNRLKNWKLPTNKITEKNPVTLRHLLSHSSGLTDNYGFLGYKPNSEIPTLLQILKKEKPAKAKKSLAIKTLPGTKERYSGAGYLIIQQLIEDVSGLSFEKVVQQYVFNPLKMTNSTYDYQPDINLKKEIAAGHDYKGKPLRKKKYHIYPEKAAAGPWTTAEDLANLMIGIQKNTILNAKLTKEMLTPQINRKGLGVNLKGLDKPEMFWHAGQNLGYTGLFYGSVNQNFGAVILLNSDGGEQIMQEFITSVANTYNWPVMQSPKALEIAIEEQKKIIGNYLNSDETKGLSIAIHKEKLVVIPKNSKQKVELFKIDENHFTFKDAQDYYRLKFKYDDDKITSLIYTESIGLTTKLRKQ